jgi:hypothetical protein
MRFRRLERYRQVARMGDTRNPYRFLTSKPLGKYLFGTPRRGWKDNIGKDIK